MVLQKEENQVALSVGKKIPITLLAHF